MIRRLVPMCLILALAGLTLAQPAEQLTRFDPFTLQVKKVGDSWNLMCGQKTLKEFRRADDAQNALRVIRELRINQHATVGSPKPVIEYWLSDGKAPFGLGSSRLPLVSFDRKSLKVESQKGLWMVRDASRPLFAFGPHETDARQALAILDKHEFNRVGYIGDPPAMMYFLAAPDPRPGQPGPPSGAASPLANLPLPAIGASNPFQFVNEGGEEKLAIDWQRCEILRDGAVYKLMERKRTLAELGFSSNTARDTLRVLQHYRFTEQCRTGSSPHSFRCYLVEGQAPRGVMFGLRSTAFQPTSLSLRQQGGAWIIWNNDRPLMSGGTTFEEAQHALRIIHSHGFDRLCWIGSPDGEGFRFLVKEKQ